MPEPMRTLRRYDEVVGKKTKSKVKKILCEELETLKINTRGKTMKEVQEIAALHNVPITVEEDDVVEGWVGKPKGQRQILWERGLLDPAITYVTKLKAKDDNADGKVEYSSVLINCFDFLNEKTCLMYLGERLGVEVDRVTKCHPELAGEGIGYSWGHATGIYKPAQLSKKKAKDNF